MKTILLALAVAFTGLELWAQTPPGSPAANPSRRSPTRFANPVGPATQPRYQPSATAPAAPAAPAQPEQVLPAGFINFTSADVNQVLDIYANLVNRTLLRPASLPSGTIVLQTKTDLTKSEVIEALQAVLALNGIAVVNIGDKFVKVLPVDQANTAGAEFNEAGATNLPNLGSYITHIVQLKYVKPSEMIPIIQPFAKLPNSILSIDSNGILVLRDYAENVKRMLEMIDRIDVSVPTEYISEVIPIRYAQAEDIASALNSLGGSGGSTVSFGSSGAASPISGVAGSRSSGGFGSMNGGMGGGVGGGMGGTTSPFGSRTGLGVSSGGSPNGTPTTGSTFQERLKSIINRASGTTGAAAGSGQDQIQVFGQTKIIADQRSNSLLVFATRQDMENIKHVISQLDVLLSQVLIEAIIMDVTIGNTFNFGVSAAQNPKTFTTQNGTAITGAGGMNNGQPFFNFLNSVTTNGFPGNLTSTLPSDNNLSYFGSIGQSWDVAVQAAETDSHANIIQRPRIQTSQAKPAQFFVGNTVPYVTGTYNNSYSGGYGGSSYSQLSVGVELDVTPFINPDGLVVMDIQQEIDDLNGYTSITGVGDVPNTIKRTLNTEIAVKDRDTVILGGFIKSDNSHSKNGIPFLQDIPWLGNLFSSRSDSKDRQELIVLMRPTVLKTPDIAAQNTIKEAQRLPGISAAAAEDAVYENKLVNAERKKEMKNAKSGRNSNGFFNMNSEGDTNNSAADFGTAPQAGAGEGDTAPAATDDKARAALDEKMRELDAQKPDGTMPAPQ